MTTDVQFMPSATSGSRVPGFGRVPAHAAAGTPGHVDSRTSVPLFNADDLLGGVKFAIVRLFELLMEWQDRARQRHHLRELNDHLLRDMGISRADVEYEASKPFWRV